MPFEIVSSFKLSQHTKKKKKQSKVQLLYLTAKVTLELQEKTTVVFPWMLITIWNSNSTWRAAIHLFMNPFVTCGALVLGKLTAAIKTRTITKRCSFSIFLFFFFYNSIMDSINKNNNTGFRYWMLSLKISRSHLDIRPSGNPLPKKIPFYEGVSSILGIFKIYVCVSLNYNFYYI